MSDQEDKKFVNIDVGGDDYSKTLLDS